MSKIVAVFALTIVAIIALILIHHSESEDFSNNNEKQEALGNWFKQNKDATFTKFKKQFGKKSDLIEFESAKAKHRDLTISR
jgi:preprotein translocase subunit SecG